MKLITLLSQVKKVSNISKEHKCVVNPNIPCANNANFNNSLNVFRNKLRRLRNDKKALLNKYILIGNEYNQLFSQGNSLYDEYFSQKKAIFVFKSSNKKISFDFLSTGQKLILLIALIASIYTKENSLIYLYLYNLESLDDVNLDLLLSNINSLKNYFDNIVLIGILNNRIDFNKYSIKTIQL